MKIINPATEEIICELEEDTKDSIEEKFDLLRNYQPKWAATSIDDRIAIITQFYLLLDKNKDHLAHTLTNEMGKPLQQAHNELNGAGSRIKFFIDNSIKWLADEWITTDGPTHEKIAYEPLGVIANISAWNYPYLVGVNVFIPALIGGNTVFYKPSEYASMTGVAITSLLYEAGLPKECFQIAIGGKNVGAFLLDLPLNGYYFTGSYRTGKMIAEKVAGKMVPCQLELGGNDPLYIMDDVQNIASVAEAVLEGVIYNNGQSCCAVERIYVHEKIYDEFIDEYIKRLNALTIGDPLDPTSDIGPLSRKEQQEFLYGLIDDAVGKGAIIAEGKTIQERAITAASDTHQRSKGYYFAPTVLINVDHTMRVMKEEAFGPVTGIQKVRDDDEALKLMQDTEYGLTAAIYSTDQQRAENMMKRMDTGTVYWNCCDRVSATLPWSGRKHSGIGSTLSYQGIRAFVQPKAYHLRKAKN